MGRASHVANRVLKLAVSLLYFVAVRVLIVCGWKTASDRLVLTYHVIAEDEGRLFDRQMHQLRKSATPIFADDVDLAGPGHFVAVTFDDAFEDVIVRILPILSRHEIPVMIFVPTGYLGAAASWIPANGNGSHRRVASADLLRQLSPRLARLGSHSVTHPRLAAVSIEQVRIELEESKRTLESITGQPIRSLALPYGSSSADVIHTAQKVGYHYVFANVPLFSDATASCRLVGRVDCSPRDWPFEFYLKLRGAYGWMAAAVPAKRQLLRTLGESPQP
jgi:peptidoglycan/xylan/chitin deacetylase (PgdA/CDA1 family)